MYIATTISPGLAGAIAGALMGAIFGGTLRFVLDRRGEHEKARSVARLIYLEPQEIWGFLGETLKDGEPWQGYDFAVPTWTEHRQLIAGELADEELQAMMSAVLGGMSDDFRSARRDRLRDLMERAGAGAAVLGRADNFAWYSGGGNSKVEYGRSG